jgi:hypothetical protein
MLLKYRLGHVRPSKCRIDQVSSAYVRLDVVSTG